MQLTQITPFVPCSNLNRQIDFYNQRLGFNVGFQAENYAFLRRDQVAIRLVEVDGDVDLTHPERQNSFYIDVDEVDALYASIEPNIRDLPSGRVRPPFDQDYGQREFHIIDEDCTLVFFGAPIRPVKT